MLKKKNITNWNVLSTCDIENMDEQVTNTVLGSGNTWQAGDPPQGDLQKWPSDPHAEMAGW